MSAGGKTASPKKEGEISVSKASHEVVVRVLLFAGWINHQVKKKVTVDNKQAKPAWDHAQSRASGKSSSAKVINMVCGLVQDAIGEEEERVQTCMSRLGGETRYGRVVLFSRFRCKQVKHM